MAAMHFYRKIRIFTLREKWLDNNTLNARRKYEKYNGMFLVVLNSDAKILSRDRYFRITQKIMALE